MPDVGKFSFDDNLRASPFITALKDGIVIIWCFLWDFFRRLLQASIELQAWKEPQSKRFSGSKKHQLFFPFDFARIARGFFLQRLWWKPAFFCDRSTKRAQGQQPFTRAESADKGRQIGPKPARINAFSSSFNSISLLCALLLRGRRRKEEESVLGGNGVRCQHLCSRSRSELRTSGRTDENRHELDRRQFLHVFFLLWPRKEVALATTIDPRITPLGGIGIPLRDLVSPWARSDRTIFDERWGEWCCVWSTDSSRSLQCWSRIQDKSILILDEAERL